MTFEINLKRIFLNVLPRILIGTFLLLSVTLATSAVMAGEKKIMLLSPSNDPDKCLKLKFSFDKKQYEISDKQPEILYEFEISNACERKVLVNKTVLPGGNLFFYFLNENEVQKPGRKEIKNPIVEYFFNSWGHYSESNPPLLIGPGESFLGKGQFQPNSGPRQEGVYKVYAEIEMYLFPSTDRSVPTKKYSIKSDPLKIEFKYKNLFGAVEGQDVQKAAELIQKGADVNMKNANNESPLFFVTEAPLLRILLDAGADVYLLNYSRGVAAFHLAVWSPELIQEYIAHKINVDTLSKEGETALHFAAGRGKLEVVKILVKAKAQLNIKDANGKTPLQWSKTPEVSEFLKQSGAL